MKISSEKEVNQKPRSNFCVLCTAVGLSPPCQLNFGLTLNEYLAGKAQYYTPESLAGHFVRAQDDGDIYAVQNGGYKRRIPSTAVLASYGVAEVDVTPVAKELLQELPTATLMRQAASERVYYLEPEGGARRWVATAQLFEALGYSWEGVAEVSSEELRWHP